MDSSGDYTSYQSYIWMDMKTKYKIERNWAKKGNTLPDLHGELNLVTNIN